MFKDLINALQEKLATKEAVLETVEAVLNTLLDQVDELIPETIEAILRDAIDKIDGEVDAGKVCEKED